LRRKIGARAPVAEVKTFLHLKEGSFVLGSKNGIVELLS
jgi:hypothetical protein